MKVLKTKIGASKAARQNSWETGVSGNRVFPILVSGHTSVEGLYAPSACFSPCPGWPQAMLCAGFIQNLPSHLTQAVTRNSSLSAPAVQCLTCSGVFQSVSGRRFPGEFGRRCQFLAATWRGSQGLLASCILNMVSHPIALTQLSKGEKWEKILLAPYEPT